MFHRCSCKVSRKLDRRCCAGRYVLRNVMIIFLIRREFPAPSLDARNLPLGPIQFGMQAGRDGILNTNNPLPLQLRRPVFLPTHPSVACTPYFHLQWLLRNSSEMVISSFGAPFDDCAWWSRSPSSRSQGLCFHTSSEPRGLLILVSSHPTSQLGPMELVRPDHRKHQEERPPARIQD